MKLVKVNASLFPSHSLPISDANGLLDFLIKQKIVYWIQYQLKMNFSKVIRLCIFRIKMNKLFLTPVKTSKYFKNGQSAVLMMPKCCHETILKWVRTSNCRRWKIYWLGKDQHSWFMWQHKALLERFCLKFKRIQPRLSTIKDAITRYDRSKNAKRKILLKSTQAQRRYIFRKDISNKRDCTGVGFAKRKSGGALLVFWQNLQRKLN